MLILTLLLKAANKISSCLKVERTERGWGGLHRRRRRYHRCCRRRERFLLHRIHVQVCARASICIIHTYSLNNVLPPGFLQGPRRFKNTHSEDGGTSLVEVKR